MASDPKSLNQWVKDYKKEQEVHIHKDELSYEIVDGVVESGWEPVVPNCRSAPMSLPAAKFAKQRIEQVGGKAIVVLSRGNYSTWPLRRIS